MHSLETITAINERAMAKHNAKVARAKAETEVAAAASKKDGLNIEFVPAERYFKKSA